MANHEEKFAKMNNFEKLTTMLKDISTRVNSIESMDPYHNSYQEVLTSNPPLLGNYSNTSKQRANLKINPSMISDST